MPIHYRFHGSWFTDNFILSYDGTPERFLTAVKSRAPATEGLILAPGQALRLSPQITVIALATNVMVHHKTTSYFKSRSTPPTPTVQ